MVNKRCSLRWLRPWREEYCRLYHVTAR